MSTSLVQAASNEYIQAQNKLKGSDHDDVYIYVEGLDDISFWNEFIQPYTHKYNFKIVTLKGVDNNVYEGKSALLQHINIGDLGQNKLIAVDADFDWIIEEYKVSPSSQSYSREIRENKYILHTYLHSIESYKCHAKNVSSIISKCTCHTSVDCDGYFEIFSKAIAELFLIHLVSLQHCDGVLPISVFTQDLNNVRIDLATCSISPKSIDYITKRNAELEPYHKANECLIESYRQKLSSLGFDESKYYLLCRGHDIRNSIVKSRILPYISKVRIEDLRELRSITNIQQRTQQIAQYSKITSISEDNHYPEIQKRFDQLLNDCTHIQNAQEGYLRVRSDLDAIFN